VDVCDGVTLIVDVIVGVAVAVRVGVKDCNGVEASVGSMVE
jgi:hypothetical protein